MAWIELDDSTPGVRHRVNVDQIVRITRYESASYTQIHFGGRKDNYIAVREPPDEIGRLIERAETTVEV
jgi:hypothetical protein